MADDLDTKAIRARAAEVLECAHAWEPDVRLIGNVTAHDLAVLTGADVPALCDEVERLRAALNRIASGVALPDYVGAETDYARAVLLRLSPDDPELANAWRDSRLP